MKWGIANSKASMGGSGDAELNLAYGLTPPSDTTKIWVKCDTPSAVKVEANRQLVISSNENAKVKTEETIGSTYGGIGGSYQTSNHIIKIGNDYYIGTNSATEYFMGNTLEPRAFYKITSDGTATKIVNSSGTYDMFSFVCQLDDTHVLWQFNYSSSYNLYSWIVDITDNSVVKQSLGSSAGTYFRNNTFYNGLVYGLSYISATSIRLAIYNYTNNSFTIQPITASDSYTNLRGCAYYNGYLYFTATIDNNCKLCRINISDGTYESVLTLPKTQYGVNYYSWDYCQMYMFENKLIVGNINYQWNTTNLSNKYIYLIDLTNNTYESIDIGYYFWSYILVNQNSGNIEIWGGYPSATRTTIKQTISNIYSLTENTLELYYDVNSTRNIRLLSSATITMDAPINHAWLGDSNNIAQPVDMYYYDNGTWKGINCSDYTDSVLI